MVEQERRRAWLEEAGLAAVQWVVRSHSASLTLTDGGSAVTLDFNMTTPEERAVACAKAERLQAIVTEFNEHMRAPVKK